jgi:hypothetical protein
VDLLRTLNHDEIGPDVVEGAAAKVLGVWISRNGCQSHKAFAIQTPERMMAFPSERLAQPVPTSLGHNCRGGESLLDGVDGGRKRRRGSPHDLSNQPYRVGAKAHCPPPSDDIRAMSTFASRSGYVFRGPKMQIHWNPPEANPVGFGSCEQVAGGGSERRVPLFAQARREASRSSDGDPVANA